MTDELKDTLETAADAAEGAAEQVEDSAAEAVAGAEDAAGDAVGAANDAADAVTDAADDAADAGTDIVASGEEALSELGVEDEPEESDDSLTYSNGVIEKIVAMATREVPHVLGMKGNLMHTLTEQFGAKSKNKGVTVDVTDDNRVIVNIAVIIEYGSYAPDIFDEVKSKVTERLKAMTGLEVAGINLRIEDVVTADEFQAAQKKAEKRAE